MKKKTLVLCILILIVIILSLGACQRVEDNFAFATDEITIKVGETITPEVIRSPANRKYTLESENTSVVGIDGAAIVALKSGVANVIGTSGTFRDTLRVIVKRENYIPPTDTYYRITYVSNFGIPPQSEVIEKGALLPPPEDMENIQGYRFTGWYTDKGYTQLFDFENTYIEEALTLYAGWCIDEDIRFTYVQLNDKWLISGFFYPEVPYKVVAFPSEASGIDARAFEGNTTLEEIYIPSSYEIIGEEAFANVINLKKVSFTGEGSNLELIASKVFYHCTALQEVIGLPSSITLIDSLAFYETSKLTSFALPDNLIEVREGAFAYSGIVSFNLNKVEKLGREALAYSSVSEVFSFGNLSEIGADVLAGTAWLANQFANNDFATIDNILIKVRSDLLAFTPPVNITAIANNCFTSDGIEISFTNGHKPNFSAAALPQVYDIVVPEHLVADYVNTYGAEIGNNIWYNSTNFNVEGKYTFDLLKKGTGSGVVIKSCATKEYSINLAEIFASSAIKKIKRTAFSNSLCPNLQIVHLPDNAEQISKYAFNTVIRALFIEQQGQQGILSLSSNPVNTIANADGEYKIYVSPDKLSAYRNAYSSFLPKANILSSDIIDENNGLCVDTSGEQAVIVQYLGDNKYLTIEAEYNSKPLGKISAYAFCGNKSLIHVTISYSDQPLYIDKLAFYSMSSQMEFVIENTTPPLLADNAFGSKISAKDYKIYVQFASTDTYKLEWSQYEDIIFPLD